MINPMLLIRVLLYASRARADKRSGASPCTLGDKSRDFAIDTTRPANRSLHHYELLAPSGGLTHIARAGDPLAFMHPPTH
jgi:hypothetical protein